VPGVIAGVDARVVVGLGFGGRAAAKPVHQPARSRPKAMETKRLSGWLISISNAFGASGFQQLIARLVKPIETALQLQSGVSQWGAGCTITV
jgi:hypothetical protein